ncbi:MAG: hypothetical protein K6A80_09290 [Saccharofermentans sp.]|nr:hypothetical protein [Saccharofermentans sp.]
MNKKIRVLLCALLAAANIIAMFAPQVTVIAEDIVESEDLTEDEISGTEIPAETSDELSAESSSETEPVSDAVTPTETTADGSATVDEQGLYSYSGEAFILSLDYGDSDVTVDDTFTDVLLPSEGHEFIRAYMFSGNDDQNISLDISVPEDAEPLSDGVIEVYSVEDGSAGDVLVEDISAASGVIEIGAGTEGIVITKDTGRRLMNLEVNPEGSSEDITLSVEGLMPQNASVDASEVEVDDALAAYDISIMDGDNEYQPDEDNPLSVEITDPRISADKEHILWHISNDGTRERVTDLTISDGKITFIARSFSMYEIVEVEEPAPVEPGDVDDLIGQTLHMYNVLNNNKYYFGNSIATKGSTTLISKTEANSITTAALWHFDLVPGTTNNFILSSVDGSGNTVYMCMNDSGNMSLTDNAENATSFTIELYDNNAGQYYIYKKVGNKKYGLNQFNGVNGKGFAGWDGKDQGSIIRMTYPIVEEDDPAGLDGKSYGLVIYGKRAAMMSETKVVGESERRVAKAITFRKNVLNQEELIVTSGYDMTMWKFQNISGDKYYVTTEVDGVTKYLQITDTSISLVDADQTDDNCILTVTQGTGTYSGKIRISNANNYSPNLYSGGVSNGFGSFNDGKGNEWFNLATPSEIKEDDFVSYEATKVSISDRVSVPDGAKVIVYTRVWDDAAKKYNYYIIDSLGNLVPAIDDGNKITWMGLKVNTLLWDFTEYHYEGTNEPNYYYELYNSYTRKYLAPQITDGQVLSDNPIGINLNGRRNGEYSSSILAWDDPYYQYAGIKTQDGKIVSCLFTMAEDFFFAIVDDIPEVDEELTVVDTVDNDDYGITLKMIDFNNPLDKDKRDSLQAAVMGTNAYSQGGSQPDLVTKWLDDGYPTAVLSDRSLSDLFGSATEVNHLFLQNRYKESGYFEYNCTENFAHLGDDNNFVVYDQVGTVESVKLSLDHGQFLPYNDLTRGQISQLHTNTTDESDNSLASDDPRRDKLLYAIPEAETNHFFGMEMSARFTQTVSGLDAWGHDIIFEFTGDDDFWLYVDDYLILDLGGIHKALSGKVNFRNGEVSLTNEDGGITNTNLRTLFEEAYRAKYPDATDDAVNSFLATKFEPGENVFIDYSAHTMKAFYMERGAGASNLRMRFNLSAVEPGSVVLTKSLSDDNGIFDDVDSSLASFPFQVWYQNVEGGEYKLLDDPDAVSYYNSYKTNVDYRPSYTLPDGSKTYDHVFFLNANDSLLIDFPDNTINYRIVECGVNNAVYDHVSCNGAEIEGNQVGTSSRYDYYSVEGRVDERPIIVFDNKISDNPFRSLNIRKRLIDKDDHEITREQDPTYFNFRVYLGSENARIADLKPANMSKYRVKDPHGYYCKWVVGSGFVSTGISDVSQIDSAETTFYTSPNGAISNIPAGYVVELFGLPIGTKFRVEERKNEIPVGYQFVEYSRDDDPTYQEGQHKDEGNIQAREESSIVTVVNRQGYGIKAQKDWSDASFTSSHDVIHFAVYVKDPGTGVETLINDSVRAIRHPNTEVIWFFDDLNGVDFSNYVVREVEVTSPVYDASDDTVVTSFGSVNKIVSGGLTTVDATPKGQTDSSPFGYTVEYDQGQPTGASTTLMNSRTDKVTNTRDGGIVINLGKWNGTDTERTIDTPLEDGVFTLQHYKNGTVENIGSFTSDPDGVVTILYDYESGGADNYYIITEIKSPEGYIGLPEPVKFYVNDDQSDVVFIDCDPADGWANHNTRPADKLIVDINIYNPQFVFEVVKYSEKINAPLSGAQFGLYRQVQGVDGNPMKDYLPVSGMGAISSGGDGILPGVDSTLSPGVYYLTERFAPTGYDIIGSDIIFEITKAGTVELISAPSGVTMDSPVFADGTYTYRMKVVDPASGSKVVPTGIDMDSEIPLIVILSSLSVLSLAGYIYSRRSNSKW